MIICALCNTPVITVARYYDADIAKMVQEAHCHGEVERISISAELIDEQSDAGDAAAYELDSQLRYVFASRLTPDA